MKHFVKISNFWYEFDSTMPLSCVKIIDDNYSEDSLVDIRNCEQVQAKKLEELDWNNTIILNNNYRTGWLSPDGKFYGCEAYYHKEQAELIHGKSEIALEKEGWIRINYMIQEDGEKVLIASFASEDETVYPTREQLKYISKNYMDNQHLYFDMWKIAQARKLLIQEEWGLK